MAIGQTAHLSQSGARAQTMVIFLYWLLERWIASSDFWTHILVTLQQKMKPQRMLPIIVLH